MKIINLWLLNKKKIKLMLIEKPGLGKCLRVDQITYPMRRKFLLRILHQFLEFLFRMERHIIPLQKPKNETWCIARRLMLLENGIKHYEIFVVQYVGPNPNAIQIASSYYPDEKLSVWRTYCTKDDDGEWQLIELKRGMRQKSLHTVFLFLGHTT